MKVCKFRESSIHSREKGKRPLRGLSIELTRKCNFKCKHCYLANPKQTAFSTPELTYKEWIQIFDQYVEEEGLFITLTGGEPLLRKDFPKIWVALKERGFLISLFTNGSLVDSEMADFLAEWTPYEVSISVYGASEATYERVTGRKNMYKHVLSVLEMLSKKGITLEVKGVFSKLNIDEFDSIKSIGERYCDLFRWDVDLMGAFACSSNHPQDIRLSAEECVDLEAAVPIRNRELETRVEHWRPPLSSERRKGAFNCNIGQSSAYIDSVGLLHPCLPLESVSYNLREGTLHHGWHNALPELLQNFPHQEGPCQVCDAFELCNHCVAFALLENCPATGPVPFRCKLAEARARKYGLTHLINIPK